MANELRTLTPCSKQHTVVPHGNRKAASDNYCNYIRARCQ